jgi:hypothetical protein
MCNDSDYDSQKHTALLALLFGLRVRYIPKDEFAAQRKKQEPKPKNRKETSQ